MCHFDCTLIFKFADSLELKSKSIDSIFDKFFFETRKNESKTKLSIVQQSVKSYKTASKHMNDRISKCNKVHAQKHPQVLFEYLSESENLFELQRDEISNKIQHFKEQEIHIWSHRLLCLLKNFFETDEKVINNLSSQVKAINLPSNEISKSDIEILTQKIETVFFFHFLLLLHYNFFKF